MLFCFRNSVTSRLHAAGSLADTTSSAELSRTAGEFSRRELVSGSSVWRLKKLALVPVFIAHESGPPLAKMSLSRWASAPGAPVGSVAGPALLNSRTTSPSRRYCDRSVSDIASESLGAAGTAGAADASGPSIAGVAVASAVVGSADAESPMPSDSVTGDVVVMV